MHDLKNATIGERLRHWRNHKQLSQLDLALECDTSARHLSFIESGKAHPTRELVIRLADAMDIPLSARTNILVSAGYAPQYDRTGLSDKDMALVRDVLENMVQQNAGKPSVLIDRQWNIVYSNDAFIEMCRHFISDSQLLEQPQPLNFLRLVLHPQGLISACSDPCELYRLLMSRARRARTGKDIDSGLEQLILEMDDYKPPGLEDDYMRPPTLVTPINLTRGADVLRLLAMTVTLGEPLNISLQELQLEFCVAADDASRELLDRLIHQ